MAAKSASFQFLRSATGWCKVRSSSSWSRSSRPTSNRARLDIVPSGQLMKRSTGWPKAIVQHKTRVIDIDLRSYFDNVRHDRLLAKVARRVDDADVMHLLKIMLKANGRCGVPQGGVISPLLSNLYLTEVDRMLERAKEVTRSGKYTYIEYARFADDLVILIDAYPRHDWLMGAVEKRLREELADLQVEINEEKSRIVDLGRGESFGFLGFDFRRIRSRRGVWRANYTPKLKKRTALLRKLKDVFRRYQSQPVDRVDAVDQPGAARLGELLCGRALQRVLQLHQRLGGKEGPAPYAAGSETQGLRLDAVE